MGLFLHTNVASLNAQRNFNTNQAKLQSSLEKLSSGFKLNRAADGAGSLLLANQMTSQVRGYAVAEENIQQGINMLNIADSALTTLNDGLQRLREVALAASNGTVTDFTAYSAEVGEIVDNVNDLATSATYNSTVLLNGSAANVTIQAGSGSLATDQVDISAAFSDNQSAALGLTQTTITNVTTAGTVLTQVDAALATVATNLAAIGGAQSELSSRLQYAQIAKENFSASEAVVRNVDVATETANLTKLQILQQASAMALSQANQMPNIAIQLLR